MRPRAARQRDWPSGLPGLAVGSWRVALALSDQVDYLICGPTSALVSEYYGR